jgi:hypothetical protein
MLSRKLTESSASILRLSKSEICSMACTVRLDLSSLRKNYILRPYSLMTVITGSLDYPQDLAVGSIQS